MICPGHGSAPPGARLIIYETGDRKCAVGTAFVVSVDASDPKNPVVQIKSGKPLPKAVSLTPNQIQQAPPGDAFVRIGRVSVVPPIFHPAAHHWTIQFLDVLLAFINA